MIVTLTPNPSIDRTYAVDRLLPGAVHRADEDWVEAGGKGVNVARVLRAHGVAVRAVLPIGGPTGESVRELLRADGIEVDAVAIDGDLRCNVTVTDPLGGVTKVNAAGPTMSPVELDDLVGRVVEVVGAVAVAAPDEPVWMVSCGSLAPGSPDSLLADVIARVREDVAARVHVAVDSSGEALRAAVAATPDVIKPNLTELEELCARPLPTFADVVEGAQQLHAAGVGTVLVSLGSEGAVLVGEDAVLAAEAPPVRVRTTVGAGDALLAGYLSHVGSGPVEALRHAVAFGAAAVQRPIGAIAGPGSVDVPSVVVTEGFEPSRPSRSRSEARAAGNGTTTAVSQGDRASLGERA